MDPETRGCNFIYKNLRAKCEALGVASEASEVIMNGCFRGGGTTQTLRALQAVQ